MSVEVTLSQPATQPKSPAILGVPYEEGMYWRKGAAEGPAAIRRHWARMGEHSLRSNLRIPWSLAEIDSGDVEIDRYSAKRTRQVVEEKVLGLLSKGAVPIVIGGDHSISLPVLRALAEHLGSGTFGVLHFDAHSDTFEPVDGYPYHHGAVIRNVIEEGLVEPGAIFQFGLRGPVYGNGLEYASAAGVHCVSRDDFVASSCRIDSFGVTSQRRYYVSIDIDVVDPAFAPGTGTPVPGGLSSSQMLQVAAQLAQLDLVGMDLVEVAPIYDPSDVTSLLAAHLIFELLAASRFR